MLGCSPSRPIGVRPTTPGALRSGVSPLILALLVVSFIVRCVHYLPETTMPETYLLRFDVPIPAESITVAVEKVAALVTDRTAGPSVHVHPSYRVGSRGSYGGEHFLLAPEIRRLTSRVCSVYPPKVGVIRLDVFDPHRVYPVTREQMEVLEAERGLDLSEDYSADAWLWRGKPPKKAIPVQLQRQWKYKPNLLNPPRTPHAIRVRNVGRRQRLTVPEVHSSALLSVPYASNGALDDAERGSV